MRRYDVAVVGGGPAGAAAAISLARRGYAVVLADKAFFPRAKLCGDFLSPANWPLFEQLGVADQLLSLEHEKITAFRISDFSGGEASVGFPVRNGEPVFGLGLRRFHLDALLLGAAEKEGVVVKQGCRVTAIAREEGGWKLALGGASAGDEVESVFLIGADGRNSSVAERLGLSRTAGFRGGHVACQIELKGVRGLQGDVQIHSFPGGYAGLVGVGGGATNLCFTLERGRTKNHTSLQSLFEDCLWKNGRLKGSLEESEAVGRLRSAYPLYFSPRRFYGDGFLLAGDAARVTEPVTGEGIFFALKSALLAADGIDLALRRRNRAQESFAHYGRLCEEVFSFRHRLNSIVRALIYRPSLLSPVIRLSRRASFPLRPLVHRLCRMEP